MTTTNSATKPHDEPHSIRWSRAQFDSDGYVVLERVLTEDRIATALIELDRGLSSGNADGPLKTSDQKNTAESTTAARSVIFGARNLLDLCPTLIDLIDAANLRPICDELLGPSWGIVRGLYFDKPPGASWALPWHQDLTIAVRSHASDVNAPPHHAMHASSFWHHWSPSTDPYSKPTTKAGVCHYEAPTIVLESMLTIRIHLDAMNATNGAVVVQPSSHAHGKRCDNYDLTPINDGQPIHCEKGSVMLMRPLLTHASVASAPDSNDHRRIVHFELAPSPNLPGGIEWAWFRSMQRSQ